MGLIFFSLFVCVLKRAGIYSWTVYQCLSCGLFPFNLDKSLKLELIAYNAPICGCGQHYLYFILYSFCV